MTDELTSERLGKFYSLEMYSYSVSLRGHSNKWVPFPFQGSYIYKYEYQN